MTSQTDGPENKDSKPADSAAQPKRGENPPEWAGGLRQLYDSVVEEPLPDSFKDLLSKLDASK